MEKETIKHICFLIFLFIISVSTILLVTIAGIGEHKEMVFKKNRLYSLLDGEHELRKTKSEKKTSMNGGGDFLYFKIHSDTEIWVYFAWLHKIDKTYIISSLPLKKFRIRFNEKIECPIIKFEWEEPTNIENVDETLRYMNSFVIQATIECQEKDWPSDVKLPLS